MEREAVIETTYTYIEFRTNNMTITLESRNTRMK